MAKKMWHRGHEAKARDLLDLCLVIETSPDALRAARDHLLRHRDAFLDGIHKRGEILRAQFEQIDSLDYRKSFDNCLELATEFLQRLESR